MRLISFIKKEEKGI